MPDFPLWTRSTSANVEVAGVRHRLDSLRRLYEKRGHNFRTTGAAELVTDAYLVPEPSNSHDKFAVRVLVDGIHIGYLPSDPMLREHQANITSLLGRGLQPTVRLKSKSHIWQSYQGTDRRGQDVYEEAYTGWAGIALDEPSLSIPVNREPRNPYRILPHGGAFQFKGEHLHLDVLAPLVARTSPVWVWATLHVIEKGTKPVVEARVDGRRIGELTPVTSTHYVPTIRHLEATGKLTVAKVLLEGNALSVEAVLYAAKAHELDETWFRQPEEPAEPARPQQVTIPPKPRVAFAVPPGWPPAPAGWEPTPEMGFAPRQEWPPPPEGWQFWVMVHDA